MYLSTGSVFQLSVSDKPINVKKKPIGFGPPKEINVYSGEKRPAQSTGK